MKRIFLLGCGVLAIFLAGGCNSPWMTNTSRNAIEEYLIASAIERGFGQVDFKKYAGKKIFLDYANCNPQVDKPYLQGMLAFQLSRAKALLVKEEKDADFIFEVLCGVLATDHDKILIGTPALPIPVPDTGISVVFPEIPLFMKFTRWGYSRFAFNILDGKRNPIDVIPPIDTRTTYTNWTVFLIPFKTMDVPMNVKNGSTSIDF